MFRNEVVRRVEDARRKIEDHRDEILHGAARGTAAIACVALAPLTLTVIFTAIAAAHVKMALAEHRHHEAQRAASPDAPANTHARFGRRLQRVGDFLPRAVIGIRRTRRPREPRTAHA